MSFTEVHAVRSHIVESIEKLDLTAEQKATVYRETVLLEQALLQVQSLPISVLQHVFIKRVEVLDYQQRVLISRWLTELARAGAAEFTMERKRPADADADEKMEEEPAPRKKRSKYDPLQELMRLIKLVTSHRASAFFLKQNGMVAAETGALIKAISAIDVSDESLGELQVQKNLRDLALLLELASKSSLKVAYVAGKMMDELCQRYKTKNINEKLAEAVSKAFGVGHRVTQKGLRRYLNYFRLAVAYPVFKDLPDVDVYQLYDRAVSLKTTLDNPACDPAIRQFFKEVRDITPAELETHAAEKQKNLEELLAHWDSGSFAVKKK